MKTIPLPLLGLLLLLLIPQLCEAQFPSPHFELIENSTYEQLGFVTSISQDQQDLLWLGTPGGLRRFDGYELIRYDAAPRMTSMLSHPVVWDLANVGDYLWIATVNGLNRLHLPTDSFTHFFHDPAEERSLSDSHIETVFFAQNGNLWVGTGNGWNRKRKGEAGFQRYFSTGENPRPARGIWEDEDGFLWLSAADSLFCLSPQGQLVRAYGLPGADQPDSPSKNLIRILHGDSRGYLWVGTDQNGLFKFDPQGEEFLQHFHQQSDKGKALVHNRISALLEESGHLWVGTYGGGLHFLNLDSGQVFQCLNEERSGLKASVIRSIFRDRAGNIWLGTEYEGFWVVKKYGNPFRIFNLSDHGFRTLKIAHLTGSADGKVWMASADGLHRFDPVRESFEHFYFQSAETSNLSNKYVAFLQEDANGDLWVATSEDLYHQQNGGHKFEPFIKTTPGGESCHGWITSFLLEKNGGIWVGSMEGLCRYLPADKRFRDYDLSPAPSGYSTNNEVFQIQQDRSGRVWVCTKGGLNLYQPETDSFRYYPSKSEVFQVYETRQHKVWVFMHHAFGTLDLKTGNLESANLPNLAGYKPSGVISERGNTIWFLSYDGIYRYETEQAKLTYYDSQSGLGKSGFLHKNTLQTSDGKIYLAGFNWFTFFEPETISENLFEPPTIITQIDIVNQPVAVKNTVGDTLDYALDEKINYTQHLELKHWQNDVTLTFASLDYSVPENNRYQYRLLGEDTTWVNRDASQRTATFTNLAPGEYFFEVKGSNSDGRWNNAPAAHLSFIILPPWWATWWAILIWVGLFLGVLFFIRRYELNRQHARAEARRLAELDNVKSELYANITHEFRTPLTIIIGLTEQLKAQASHGMKSSLDIVKRNGKQLLNLVNQLLDLSKLESGNMELNMIQGEVIAYLNYITESFQSFAKQKNIRLRFDSDVKTLTMDYDPERLQQVLVNLLSNAIKFTKAGGKVDLIIRSGKDFLKIIVQDSGPGIRAEELPYIFDRFYQADSSSTRKGEGTGIGLALAKEIVNLMEGEISAESKFGSRTTFTVKLPIVQTAESDLPAHKPVEIQKLPVPPIVNETPQKEPLVPKPNKPLLLIVEDNSDVLRYIASCLSGRYRLAFATNGQQGIEKAFQLIPDLVISDVMMPVKDGFELCQSLKLSEITSHIPIILLTAKADTPSRLAGLSKGADAYLTKPFDEGELLTRVRAMLELRARLQKFYGKWNGNQKNQKAHEDLQGFDSERLFLKKARKVVEKNLKNPHFNVNQFAKEVGMSKSQLYRKMTGLTGRSAGDFITSLRMKHAKELLRQEELTISEVAFQSGFTDPSYFSRIFKKEFEMSPRDYRKQGL